MKKVIVTGGCGFIGSHVVEKLLDIGYEVYVADNLSTGSLKNLSHIKNDNLNIILCDIAKDEIQNIIQDIKPNIIMLIAAQASVKVSIKDPVLDAKSNIVGLVNILESAKNIGCEKVIFASSGGTIYGNVNCDKLPLQESYPLDACSFYGLTKMTAINYLKIYKSIFGLNYVALALGNVYGPRQSPDGEAGVIAIFTKKILNKQNCIINGDGQTTRDYIYVTDVADAFVNSIEHGEGLFNIGRCEEISVNEIFNSIKRSANLAAEAERGPELEGEVRRVCLDISKARKYLNWEPKITLDDGIKNVIEWIKDESKKEQSV